MYIKEKAMATVYYKENKITSANIDDFKNFIAQIAKQNKENPKQPSRISDVELSENIELKEFFSQDMSKEDKQETEITLARALAAKCTLKHRQQLLEMINTNPQFVSRVFSIAGNGLNTTYEYLIKGLKERTIGENLKFYDSMLKSDNKDFWHMDGQPQPIKHLTPKQKQIISGWSNLDKHSSDKADLASAYMRDLLEKGVLLNCDNLPTEIRKQVNQYAINSSREIYSWQNLESRFMDKEFLGKLLKKGSISNKTEKYYASVRDAILREAEKAPKFDASNYGKEIPLSKRVQTIIEEINGAENSAVVFDAYIQAAQKDITEGRAAELDASALKAVLSQDKNNYYIRKIPSEVIQRAKIDITSQQRKILDVSQVNKMADYTAASFAEQVATSKTLNRAEKDQAAQTLDKIITEKASKLQADKQKLEEKNLDYNKYNELTNEYRKAAAARETIQGLQQLYDQILTSLKDGKPNSQEKNIVDMKQVESIISNILAGKSGQMAYPEQKGLPLLFGRKEEQQRREQLGEAIHNFNESLKKVKANSEELKQYSGSILSKETLEQASSKEQETIQNMKQMTEQINHKWQDQKIDENEIKQAENDLGKMQEAKGKILKRKHQIQELAKENMSIGDEKLEDVSHLKGEEKHKARAANKAKGKDKLAEKENIAKSGKDALSAARTKKLEDLKYQR